MGINPAGAAGAGSTAGHLPKLTERNEPLNSQNRDVDGLKTAAREEIWQLEGKIHLHCGRTAALRCPWRC